MPRWERSIDINATPARVWQIMSDVKNWPEWTPSIESVEAAPDTLSVGSQATVKAKGTPTATWTVTEVNPGQNFTWVTSVRGSTTVGEHIIQPNGEGKSRVTLAIEVKGLMGAIFKPMINKVITGNLELESNGLKQRSEAS